MPAGVEFVGSMVSGYVEARDLESEVTATTVSGDITLLFPEDLDADIDFESLSGDFHADFDVDLESRRNRWVGSHVRGTIGDGGRRLSLNTVSGDVRLRRTRTRSQVR